MDLTAPPAALPLPARTTEPARGVAPDAAARKAAEAFETTFLAEMLKQTGINGAPEGWGGGAGEDAFAGFLTNEYARLLAGRGGIGLAEHIFAAITRTEGSAR